MSLSDSVKKLKAIRSFLEESEKESRGKGSKAKKSQVKTYDTIRHALSSGYYGQMFTTKFADLKGNGERKVDEVRLLKVLLLVARPLPQTLKALKSLLQEL